MLVQNPKRATGYSKFLIFDATSTCLVGPTCKDCWVHDLCMCMMLTSNRRFNTYRSFTLVSFIMYPGRPILFITF